MTPGPAAEELSAEQLVMKLSEVLESWPLYRLFRYGGQSGHHVRQVDMSRVKFSMLPKRISLYCTRCRNPQQWQTDRAEVYFTPNGFEERKYTCRNCGMNSITYFFGWRETEEGGLFIKVGQYPPLNHQPPKDLAKRLDKDDLDFYVKALDSRNFGYGLGALAYLRRVVENRTNDLLDLIAQAARQEDVSEETLKEIDQAKRSTRYEDKLEFADKVIPSRLKPEGFNPIGSLYRLASGGIHRESEDECIEIFDRAKLAFEYLFSQLEHETLATKAYVESLKALEGKPKAGAAQIPEVKE